MDQNTVKVQAENLTVGDALLFNGDNYGVQKIEEISVDVRITIVPFEYDDLPAVEKALCPVIILCNKKTNFLQLA